MHANKKRTIQICFANERGFLPLLYSPSTVTSWSKLATSTNLLRSSQHILTCDHVADAIVCLLPVIMSYNVIMYISNVPTWTAIASKIPELMLHTFTYSCHLFPNVIQRNNIIKTCSCCISWHSVAPSSFSWSVMGFSVVLTCTKRLAWPGQN